MCKFCKRLKELNELDKKDYQRIINAWKRRDLKAREIISDLYLRLQEIGFLVNYKHEKIVEFLSRDYVD